MRGSFLSVAAFLALAGCAAPPADRGVERECFWASQVSGFGDAGQDRAIVRIANRARWELTLSPGCPDVNWAQRIGIRARGGERICPGRPAELILPDSGGARRCLVREIHKLAPDP